MAGILMTIFWSEICALAFVRTNYAVSKSGRGDAEVKRHDVVQEKLQKARDKQNEQRRSCVFIVNFEQISHTALLLLLSTLNK